MCMLNPGKHGHHRMAWPREDLSRQRRVVAGREITATNLGQDTLVLSAESTRRFWGMQKPAAEQNIQQC